MQGLRSLRLLARNAINTSARRGTYHGPPKHKIPTMNDMPVPHGDFMVLHAARQRKFNTILGVGIVMQAIAWAALYSDEVIHFHWNPPSTYE